VNKFLENIKAVQANQTVTLEKPMSVTQSIQENSFGFTAAGRKMYDYRIGINIGYDITCVADELDYNKKRIQSTISGLVYGDLEYRLQHWLYETNLRAHLNQEELEEFFDILRDMR